ncbi:hypothetical protein ACFX13_023850 [Malus domestica]
MLYQYQLLRISFWIMRRMAYTGFPILGIEWQKMENRALCNSVGMKRDQKGIRVRVLKPSAPESQLLKPSDVILSFDGVNIASDGTGKLSLCDFERQLFSFLVDFAFTRVLVIIYRRVAFEHSQVKCSISFLIFSSTIPR